MSWHANTLFYKLATYKLVSQNKKTQTDSNWPFVSNDELDQWVIIYMTAIQDNRF